MVGLRQSSVAAKTPKLSTTVCLGAAAGAAAAGGSWLWGRQGGYKVQCVHCVSTSRGRRLRPSVLVLMMFLEVD